MLTYFKIDPRLILWYREDMNNRRVLQLSAIGLLLLPTACDDAPTPPRNSEAERQERTLSPVSTPATPAAPQSGIALPTTEEEYAQALRLLLATPSAEAIYSEQVKQVTESYLRQYHHTPELRALAMQCFIQALCLQPQRFAGKDFDQAMRYCEYLEGTALTPALPAMRVAIRLADYRLPAAERQQLLLDLKNTWRTENKEQSSHLIKLLCNHATPAEKEEYTRLYFSELDYPGNPCRLYMLSQNLYLPDSVENMLAEEAAQGADADSLCAIIRNLQERHLLSPQAATHPALQPLVLTVQLEQLLRTADTPAATLHSIAEQLQKALPPTPAAVSLLALASYHRTQGNPAEAIPLYRQVTATESPHRQQALFCLAETLAATQAIDEAEALYIQLSKGTSPQVVTQALQALLQLQRSAARYTAALNTTGDLLRVERNHAARGHILMQRAELAETIGNITEAINTYSQIELEHCTDTSVSIRACLNMLKLLQMRNNKAKTDKRNGTYTPSDAWYAWVRGKNFIKSLQHSPELIESLTPQEQADFQQIQEITAALGIDYNVVTEERDRKHPY